MLRTLSEWPYAPRYYDHPHGRMHYVEEGPASAPPLLMLHGNPSWSFMYRHLIATLKDRHRVIAVDHLGCGRSDKPEAGPYTLDAHIRRLDAFVSELGLERFDLAVHDWGGAIGMGLATEAPHRVERLVVFNTAAFPSSRIPLSINLCRLPGLGAVAIRGFNGFARAALARCVVHRERLTPDVRAGYLEPYDSWAHRVAHLRFVQDIPMSDRHPSWPRLVAISEGLGRLGDKPMLVVWGGRDFCFDDRFLEEWRRRFPQAEFHHVADAGHYVVEDAHERIGPWMQRFLERPS